MIIKNDPDIIKAFLEDNSGLKGGYVKEVFFPESIEEIAAMLSKADKKHIPVTVAGNGTGVTGGRIPFGGVALSTEKLNKIIDINKISDKNGLARVQAGVMLKDIKEAVSKENLSYLPDPTEDTAYIGGNVATNASGARGYKYGPTRRYIRGLKVILANGQILDLKRGEVFAKGRVLDLLDLGYKIKSLNLPTYKMPSIKNASGYYIDDHMDFIDIFIGQEGTLGVIGEVELDLTRKEGEILTFFTFFDRDKDAHLFVSGLKKEGVLSIEYFDNNSLHLLKDKFVNIPESDAAVFFEKELTKDDEDRVLERISGLLKRDNASYEKTWLAQSANERKRLYEIRHGLPEAVNEIVKKNGFPKVGTDIAVPEEGFPKMLALYKSVLSQCGIPYVIFGHIAECHLHVNMLPSSNKEYLQAKELYLKFVEAALRLGGTVSAEHGIGKLKHKYLEKMYGLKGIKEMASLKKGLDPNCILGIGNLFPRETLE